MKLTDNEKREVELVWNGKTCEVIEQVDKPRAQKASDTAAQFDLFDTRGRQKSGWTNKHIWGDTKLILSSLKNGPSREEERAAQLAQKEKDFIALILRAYKAETVENFKCFHGRKAGRLVAVGPVNLPVTRLFVEEIILECREKRVSRVDVLAFEFEMGLFPNIQEEAKAKGIDPALRYIEVKPHVKKGQIAVENAADGLKNGANTVAVENGQIVKVAKDKHGIVTREVLTKVWTEWIDYWSVDFDFESKREIIRDKKTASGEVEERWTGDFIFGNEWQSFRAIKDRSLELTTPKYEVAAGRRYKIAVNTMKIVEVGV